MRHNVSPGLAQVKANHIARLTQQAQATMLSGYTSNALGTDHVYPSGLIDQSNMTVSVTASLLPGRSSGWTTPFTCVLPANQNDPIWPWEDHTAAQIQQAGEDGKAFITAQRLALRTLIAQVAAQTSEAAVLAIQWS